MLTIRPQHPQGAYTEQLGEVVVTQEFHIFVTPEGGDQYRVRTLWGERGVPVTEEYVTWDVDAWLAQAKILMDDPLLGLLRGDIPLRLDDRGLQSSGWVRPPANLVAFGQTLYDALFQGTIRDSWMTARGVAQHSQAILRLRLGLKDVRLSRLPWEVLYEGDRPIAAGTDVIFSRYHSSFTHHSPAPFPLTLGSAHPLRILMVLAAPSDQEVLALKQEALHLQTELRAAGTGDRAAEIELTILEQPGREQLTEQLEHQRYHVFHYAGHSDLGTGGGSLSLVNSRTGLAETLNGDDLAGLLVNNGIHLAVLNSCRGAHTATSEQSESNLAEALAKRGIPAVLAMAERIPDDVALNLSRLFYRNLKQAYSIDLSLNRARQGLISSYSSDQLYWALPILYLHPQFNGSMLPGGDRPRPSDLLVEARVDRRLDAGTQLEADSLASDAVNFAAAEFDPDDLEFLEFEDLEADLEYEADLETVAQLVNQLSQGSPFGPGDPAPLPAGLDENLLPEPESRPNYTLLPDRLYDTPSQASVGISTSVIEPGVETAVALVAATGDVEMYLELERMLAEAGKLTDAIAIGNRAIQARPGDARAYHNLALALLQAGYLSEAIAALQQSIQLEPEAETYHQLGLALQQQGNLAEAIQAFRLAIQLEPQGRQAQQNLETALRRQSAIAPHWVEPWVEPAVTEISARSGSELPESPTPLPPTVLRSRRRWGWAIGLGLAGATLLGGGLLGGGLLRGFSWPLPAMQPLKTSLDRNPSDLSQVSTKIVVALATEQLNQGNLPAAQRSIEALLNRNALTETSAVLTPSLAKSPEDPIVNALMGRLALQSVRAKNADYGLDDAVRFWGKAIEKRPNNSLYLNALGSAYYAKGDLDWAQRSWQRSLELLGEDGTSSPKSTAPPSQEALAASLGLALTQWKFAESQTAAVRSGLLTKAIELRQQVLALDPVNSQPEALAKNWIWTEKAVQDWRSLLATKAPA